MTTLSLSLTQGRRVQLIAALGFILALAAASQVAIPLPGTPVPFTLQPLLVVLAGMILGPVVGAASMAGYLVLGAAGLPVFAPIGAIGIARFVGPTGGYLLAYPAAAWIAGSVASRWPSITGRVLAASTGILALYIGGIAQLTVLTGSVSRAIALGVTPFALLDLGKAVFAALITRGVSGRRESRAAHA
jgi:biotin transport system substrate-specific component